MSDVSVARFLVVALLYFPQTLFVMLSQAFIRRLCLSIQYYLENVGAIYHDFETFLCARAMFCVCFCRNAQKAGESGLLTS